ncbi:hypothetical protein FLJC2902T_17220 [Flavobacterium limnosediminis JC2902]|uniref:Uncharacterized protein n=1 Tax=Flavobacterium limnosediminis JC2902 TaxID=1341181 RepID=V6SP21_9FLAO|nr:hypothetical protein [Flavobacterium limnosediminis]ESU28371.1 hypothetical protein FLJC2902T_17220 [Flavobacterium limnosediminis JC2902]
MTMLKTIPIQEVGKRPTLHRLPILLQQPVDQVTNYLCVAAVEYQEDTNKNYITFHFDEYLQMEIKAILAIFATFQFRISFLNHNPAQRFLKISVVPSKALLN